MANSYEHDFESVKARLGKAIKHIARVVIPDSHGNHIDRKAAKACIRDVKLVAPRQVVLLGDHLDCGGVFNAHQRNYTNELCESYEEDADAANGFLDDLQRVAPDAEFFYLEGNHEAHVERWAARAFTSRKDAEGLLEKYGPASVLDLRGRGIRYFKRSEHYMGISIPGTIRLGKCYFTHGISAAKYADAIHLARFGANVVFGHCHRRMDRGERTVTSSGMLAACPGTLAKLQPLYLHTNPSSWMHGYGLQFVNMSSGRFIHWNVPIIDGQSLLFETVAMLSRKRAA